MPKFVKLAWDRTLTRLTQYTTIAYLWLALHTKKLYLHFFSTCVRSRLNIYQRSWMMMLVYAPIWQKHKRFVQHMCAYYRRVIIAIHIDRCIFSTSMTALAASLTHANWLCGVYCLHALNFDSAQHSAAQKLFQWWKWKVVFISISFTANARYRYIDILSVRASTLVKHTDRNQVDGVCVHRSDCDWLDHITTITESNNKFTM